MMNHPYKVSTFNVNSIRSRLDILTNWLKSTRPDVVLLQELKCVEENFPKDVIEELGYNFVCRGQKTYNGVAILSKTPIEEVNISFPGNPDESQARFIEAYSYLGSELYKFISVYVPNGQSVDSDKFNYKLSFLENLFFYLRDINASDEKIIIGGDFNVALTEIDVFDHKNLDGEICYHPLERQLMRKIINLGYSDVFRDLNHNISKFSWWDYRAGSWAQNKGMRIDYLLLNHSSVEKIKSAFIEDELRSLASPSDHAPVSLLIE
jgi:exodeoxyribonuclease-3